MASSSAQPPTPTDGSVENKPLQKYLKLYKAAITGDWETAEGIFKSDSGAVTAKITIYNDTALHVAATGSSIYFMEKLMEKMSNDELASENDYGFTALHLTAGVGNIEAAKLLVNRNPHLPNKSNRYGMLLPLHLAAGIGNKDMILYLLPVTSPLEEKSGSRLVTFLIIGGLYGVALHLLQLYPMWAVAEVREKLPHSQADYYHSPLSSISRKASAFPSGSHLNFWQHLIYSCVPVKSKKFPIIGSQVQWQDRGVVENKTDGSQVQGHDRGDVENQTVFQKLNGGLWNVIDLLVPQIKYIRDQKLMHQQTHELVKFCCKQIIDLENDHNSSMLRLPFLSAVELGIHEILQEILASYPAAISFIDDERRSALDLAIINRREKVFNLISQMGVFKVTIHLAIIKVKPCIDDKEIAVDDENVLHLAGKLAPLHRRNLVSGAALQMQRELQWFKEVEKFVLPTHKEVKNKKGMTPRMVFTEEHEALVKEGEQWMKDRANSCTFVAALIATVVFAAAITVPGNYGNDGVPIFSKDKWFVTFAISDAISLFSSLSSAIMFLSILTSRYAEDDFLYALPKRLIIGLVTLFVSIISLVVAFSATLYLVFAHRKPWILIPVGAMASLPITLFMFLQFPLLVDMTKSTYGSVFFRGKVKVSSYRYGSGFFRSLFRSKVNVSSSYRNGCGFFRRKMNVPSYRSDKESLPQVNQEVAEKKLTKDKNIPRIKVKN